MVLNMEKRLIDLLRQVRLTHAEKWSSAGVVHMQLESVR